MQTVDLRHLDYGLQDTTEQEQHLSTHIPSGVSLKPKTGPSCSGSTLGDGNHSQNMRNALGVFTQQSKARDFSKDAESTDGIKKN